MITKFSKILVNALIYFPSNLVTDRLAERLIRYFIRENSLAIKTRFGYYINVGGDHDALLSGIRSSVILGHYEADYIRLLASMVKPDETVIDIGANEGYITFPLSMKIGEGGHAFAIEPHPSNVRMLKANITLNALNNITVIQKAVSDKPGRLNMYGDRAWGTLLKQQSNNLPSVISVEVDTLDAIFTNNPLRQLSLIKIDAEGSEIRVIRGAHELITSNRPIVAFEINLTLLAYEVISVQEAFDFFLSNDYSLFVESNGRLVKFDWLNERISNCVAMPKERL